MFCFFRFLGVIFLFLVGFLNFGFCFELVGSEVKFGGDEFVELVWNVSELNGLGGEMFFDELNLSVVDESGKRNFFSLVSFVNDSDYVLFVGNKFLDSVGDGVFDLNCSVFVSDKTQVSNGGLKSGGESFSIFNFEDELFSFSFLSEWDFSFGSDESLSFDFLENVWEVGLDSVCLVNVFLNSSLEVPEENGSSDFSCGDYFFDVELRSNVIFEEEFFEFRFLTNFSEEFLVEYWVEDFFGDVVKSVANSSSLRWKRFTPTVFDNGFRFFGVLRFGNCSFLANSSGFFVFEPDYSSSSSSSGGSGGSKVKEKVVYVGREGGDDSRIGFLNLEDVLSGDEDVLFYEVYRGDDRKSTVDFFVGSRNFLKVKVLDKFSNVSGRVLVSALDGQKFRISGLGFDFEYNFSFDGEGFLENSVKKSGLIGDFKREKQRFEIVDLNLSGVGLGLVGFDVDSNILDLDSESSCYLNFGRRWVSEAVFGERVGWEGLELDFSGFDFSDFILDSGGVVELKLLCKYRRDGFKVWKYESEKFNYSFEGFGEVVEVDFFSKFDVEGDDSDLDVDLGVGLDLGLESESFFDGGVSGGIVYMAKNYDYVRKSFWFVGVGFFLLCSIMVVFW